MIVEITGGGDLTTNARPVLTMKASDGNDACAMLRFAALVVRGIDPTVILINGLDDTEEGRKSAS